MMRLEPNIGYAGSSTGLGMRRVMLAIAGILLCIPAWPLFAAPFAYIANSVDNTISVIDTASGTVSSTLSSTDFSSPTAWRLTRQGRAFT